MKIVIRQVSGLGNQLFQYAAGVYYAQRYNATLEIAIDDLERQFSHGYPRPFLLSKFRVESPLRPIGLSDRLYFASKPGLRELGTVLRRVMRVRHFTEPIAQRHTFLEDLPLEPRPRTLYLSGYWQSAGLVESVAASLRRQFQLKEPAAGRNLEVLEQIRQCETPVSLHIRRGDYTLAIEGNIALSMDFYPHAIRILRERLPNPTFFVFSDDIEFSRANLPAGLPAVFVDHNDSFTAHEDLRLMSACRHHIIANSSFSWWGAWLNPDPHKIVLAPRLWLAKPGSFFPGLMPPGWTVVD